MSENIQNFIPVITKEMEAAEAIFDNKTKTNDERQVALGAADQLNFMLYRIKQLGLDMEELLELAFHHRDQMMMAAKYPVPNKSHDDVMESDGRLNSINWLIDAMSEIMFDQSTEVIH